MMPFSLKDYDLTVADVRRNCSAAELYEDGLLSDKSRIAAQGALVAYSGDKTGRSPKDKRVVKHPDSQGDIWWGPVNIPLERASFLINRERARDYLNTRKRLYVFDGFAGWDPANRLKVRVICSRPYHALFMHIMLIRPTEDELASFGTPDFIIYNAGEFPANRLTSGMTSKTSIDLSFEDKEMIILGTEYAGEMKKGVFSIMNYLMPKRGILSMHCSATADAKTGESSVLFGLSGTGKTTLSADPKRHLIGDDEHCWSESGLFNIEGGCYAKTIDLSSENEPDIYNALGFGSVLENVVLVKGNEVDYNDAAITQNTRGAYPVDSIKNAKIPCVAGHPTNVIFLTCDAFGVLPPVAKLTPEQAMYHFMSGYTAKIPGTEVEVNEPGATFSPCFGGPFLVWHPTKYAELLKEKLMKHKANVWLVNTGWSGGSYNGGKRMKLAITRAIIDAIHAGTLANAPTAVDPIFGLHTVTKCGEISQDILIPRRAWADGAAYDVEAKKLAKLFVENFAKYADYAGAEVIAAGPRLS
ncbi:MAG: phosphoenolpyruvate carboxykinase (ATP) [Fimbriiglobus sp.]